MDILQNKGNKGKKISFNCQKHVNPAKGIHALLNRDVFIQYHGKLY